MYTIKKEFHFSASHRLNGLPIDHPCGRMHGHNYVVTVELQSETLNEIGFIRDYHDLDVIKEFIDDALDHNHLNDFLMYNPTAENMAKDFYELFKSMIPEVSAVTVSETPKTSARYAPTGNDAH